MSYPKKSAGLRRLMVNGTQYRWCFHTGAESSNLTVYGPQSGRQALQVMLLGWRDEWLAFPEPTVNQPRVIKPVFVCHAIEFGLLHGWQPEKPGGPKQIQWQDGEFTASPERTVLLAVAKRMTATFV